MSLAEQANPEIVPVTKPESELDQPKGASKHNTPILKTISLISTIYKWNPTGIRVVVNLPLIGNDRNYLFMIRCSPFIPNLANDAVWLNSAAFSNALSANMDLVVHDTDDAYFASSSNTLLTRPTFTTDPGVYIYHHSLPPLISELARANRYWTGGLKFRLRTKAAFTHNAVLFATPLYGTKPKISIAPATNNKYFVPYRQKMSYGSSQANSYMYNDLTMTRHMEMEYNYQKPFNYVDQFANMSTVLATYSGYIVPNGQGVPIQYTDGIVVNHFEDFIGIGLRGTIDNSSSGDNQIMFEVDIAAAEDFQFSGETAYPKPISDDHIAFNANDALNIRQIGTAIPSGNYVTPRVYSNPQFASGVNPQFDIGRQINSAQRGALYNVSSSPYTVA